MFVMDMPVDVPVQNPPAVVVMATQPKKGATKTDHTIGVCHLIQNPPVPPLSAVNSLSPVLTVKNYIWKQEHILIDKAEFKAAKVTLLQKPKHGELEDLGTYIKRHGVLIKSVRSYAYNPKPDYRGPDRATFLVELAGRRVKVEYFFNVLREVPGGKDEYDPYEDKKYCPNGEIWKISLNPDDPGSGLVGFEPSFTLTQALNGVMKPKLVFADLPGDAVGEATGNTIMLDLNHGSSL